MHGHSVSPFHFHLLASYATFNFYCIKDKVAFPQLSCGNWFISLSFLGLQPKKKGGDFLFLKSEHKKRLTKVKLWFKT